jgi:hypothetical protein
MYTVKLNTVYKRLERLGARTIALVSHNLREVEAFEDGGKVMRGEPRLREDLLRNHLVASGIRFTQMFVHEIHDHRAAFRKKRRFEACVIMGEPFYQLFRTASLVRAAKYAGPILLEITEDEAIKAGSIISAERMAEQHKQEALLSNLVYLTKTMQSPRVLSLNIAPPSDDGMHPSSATRAKASIQKEFRPSAIDLAEPPGRIKAETYRIIRDTKAARSLKRLYEHKCQICGTRIEVAPGAFYSEVHHIRPLGGKHKGLDATQNMLVLCPNHHAIFDLGLPEFTSATSVQIFGVSTQISVKHEIGADVIEYHNRTLRPTLAIGSS